MWHPRVFELRFQLSSPYRRAIGIGWCHLSVGVPQKVRIETNIVQAVKKCYKIKIDSRDF